MAKKPGKEKKAVKTAKPKVTKKAKPEVELKPYQDEKQLREMYPKMTAGEISRKFNVSRSVILHYLRKHGIKITTRTSARAGQRKTDVDRSFHEKEFLEKCIKEGLSIHKIALMCKCTYGQVRHMVEKHNLMGLIEQQKAKVEVKQKKPKKK